MTSEADGASEGVSATAPAATPAAEPGARTGRAHPDETASDAEPEVDRADAAEDAEPKPAAEDGDSGPGSKEAASGGKAPEDEAPKDAAIEDAAPEEADPKSGAEAQDRFKDLPTTTLKVRTDLPRSAAPKDLPTTPLKAGAATGTPKDAAPKSAPKDLPTTPLKAGATSATPKDAAPKSVSKDGDSASPPKDAAPKDAAPKVAEPEDAPKDAPKEAGEPGPKGGPVVRPLVSDLYAGQNGEGGAVAFGKPGTPTRAVPPVPPMPPGKAPLPPAAAGEGAKGGDSEGVGPQGTRTMPVPPMPDKDPLKLLAELTNTPPPPQTLLRTIGRRFKIWTPLAILLVLVFVLAQALRPLPSPSLVSTTEATYRFPGTPLPQSMPWPGQGQAAVEVEGLGSLGVRGAQTPVPIASVTKVMTAFVILRDHPISGKQNGPVITVDKQAADESGSTEESTAHVQEGQKFTERQMLELLLVPSGNNIARLLARWDAGTQEAFVAKMQHAAAGFGMTHTTYTGASGFESTTQSTAVDQLKLARQVMQNDVFRAVVAQPHVDIPGVGTIYNNNNDLVNLGVVGIKTGSSTPAGGALMWAAHKTVDGKQQLILGVVLQQRGGVTVNDSLNVALQRSQSLINSIQGGMTSATILKKGEVVGEVDDGLGGRTPVVAAADLKAIGWPGMTAGLTLTPQGGGLPHNAKAGTQVGTIGFGTGTARTTVPVVLQTDLNAPSFGKKLTRIS
ncbi:D-alanyl-D-alanine carboxypeptidase [Streptomyces sp. NPDC020917]|uniref:D-alanyl-D-alanine carboxypeptidase n=1 Tax=Streptomyces sp. NPDC020917 TaxID=3365102 RepID=UPI00379D8B20